MNKNIFLCLLMLSVMLLSSCEKANFTSDEEETVTTSSKGKSVKISLRSADTTPIEYPVRIYAFDSDGQCKGSAMIMSAEESSATLKLPKGKYRLSAVSLPESYPFSDSSISPSSSLHMPDAGYSLSPFSTGNADITVTSSESQSVSIRMGYRQAAVNVTFVNTPSDVIGMDVSISSPYSTMSLDGAYADTKSVTVSSVKSGDSWVTPTFYIMPTRPSQTVLTMHLSFADGASESYSYTYNATLDAATPYIFTGKYDGGVADADINASVQGGEWGEPIVTDFDFGPGVDINVDKNATTWYLPSLPKEGDVVNGHVVVIADEVSTEESNILLMSLEEWNNVYSLENKEKGAETQELANRYVEDCLMDWRFPTESEAKQLNALYSDDASLAKINTILVGAGGIKLSKKKTNGDNMRYLCGSGRTTFTFVVDGKMLGAGSTVTYGMRLVKSITAKLK